MGLPGVAVSLGFLCSQQISEVRQPISGLLDPLGIALVIGVQLSEAVVEVGHEVESRTTPRQQMGLKEDKHAMTDA